MKCIHINSILAAVVIFVSLNCNTFVSCAKGDDSYEYYDDILDGTKSTKNAKHAKIGGVMTKPPGKTYHKSPKFLEMPPEKKVKGVCAKEDCGVPLFLSGQMENTTMTDLTSKSRVSGHKGLEIVRSYSGFLTVDKFSDSHLFFWFFPELNNETSSPLIIWLQGGPGQSALFGIFNLHGPFELTENLEVKKREYSWARSFNMLYLDNPVGTGFSFTRKNQSYPRSQEAVADHLYQAVNQFFKLFPDYRDNHVYICGEGFGAKFAVSLANKIHSMKQSTSVNLKGIALGNPYIDQEVLTDHGQFLYELGLLNEEQLNGVSNHMMRANYAIHRKAWNDAMDNIEQIFGSDYRRPKDRKFFLPDMTGLENGLTFLETQKPEALDRYVKFMEKSSVRRALHVGNQKFQKGSAAYEALREDIPQTVKNWLSYLLDNYHVLFYGGNLDLRVPYPLTRDVLYKIRWKHLDDYKNSTRLMWKVEHNDPHVAGYVHHVKNFFEVSVINSGGAVARDQPRAALDMMNRFIWGRAFNYEEFK